MAVILLIDTNFYIYRTKIMNFTSNSLCFIELQKKINSEYTVFIDNLVVYASFFQDTFLILNEFTSNVTISNSLIASNSIMGFKILIFKIFIFFTFFTYFTFLHIIYIFRYFS